MPDRITAKEIIRQSHQGISVQPFLIRADDDQTYFVKGLSRALGAGLVSEALAAELGAHFGLPIPPWKVMDIPQELIDFSVMDNVQDLSGGPAFASLQVDNASDLLWASLNSLPVDLKRRVLLFDWWILNGDRGLGERGGNVNLILDPKGDLAVIDHNVAFDPELSFEEFRQYHVFRDQLGFFQGNLLARLDYLPQLDAALGDWGRITSLLPDEWIYRDQGHGDEIEPTLQQRLQILERFKEEQFWGQL
ncbi:MAG: HipA family kinase [Pseudomonas sp.]|uniref:HipA family kinase n=1 Tax=Pseudomonas sp. TaxID=306 RepID=UPI003D6FDC49